MGEHALIRLTNPAVDLGIEPDNGGSIVFSRWRERDILRSQVQGGSILDSACFPLVPFSNRIAGSAFRRDGESIRLRPNHPADPDSPVLHGIGWLEAWDVDECDAHSAQLSLTHEADADWPWAISAVQRFALRPDGFALELSLTNRDRRPMPAGLGFHPYFPCTAQTVYRGLHRGEWATDDACLPTVLREHDKPRDWWDGKPVATRMVDTVYTGRDGSLAIAWPDRGIGAEISPSADLSFTTVYVRPDAGFFCVEPVSHMTDAVNRAPGKTGLRVLDPQEEWTVSVEVRAYDL